MSRSLPAAFALVLLVGPLPGGKVSKGKDAVFPLTYTVRTEQGDRAGHDRDAVLKTVKMTEKQVRAWAEDPKAAKQNRSASLFQGGYVEVIGRGADGHLEYTVRDSAGVRSSRDRAAVLKTLKMTAEQLRKWGRDPRAKEEARHVAPEEKVVAQVTVSTESASVASRDQDSAAKAAKLAPAEIRKWAADPRAEKEGRSAVLFGDGHVEVIWRGPGGRLLYSVRTELGTRTGGDRDAVMKTLKMTDKQVRAWAEDDKAAKEARSATFFREGFVEVISRGPAVEPPGRPQ